MTDFNQTNWARTDFSRDYVEKADIYIVERRKMFGIVKSFYRHFLADKGQNRVLDLGCGDGTLTHEIMGIDDTVSAVLVDGSVEMLKKAKGRLGESDKFSFVQAAFQEIIRNPGILPGNCDFAFSSMAIHHLATEEKKSLFGRVCDILVPGGFFINIDVVLAPSGSLDEWYMKLWEDWMDEKRSLLGSHDEKSADIIKRYKDLEENKPDTLDSQMDVLRDIGFRDVDCFYKYGIFAVFGGRK